MKKALMIAAILTVSTTIMAEENIASRRLTESVISTENFETSVLDTAKNVTIVTQEDIQNKGASTVAEALERFRSYSRKQYSCTFRWSSFE